MGLRQLGESPCCASGELFDLGQIAEALKARDGCSHHVDFIAVRALGSP